jgi:mono/diheme cytochrome c family protein
MNARSRPASAAIVVLLLLAVGLAVGLVGVVLRARWAAEQTVSAPQTSEQASGHVAGVALPPPIDLNASEAGAGVPSAEPTALALGAAIYAARCASCHGPRGEGEPNWQVEREDGTLPAPPHDTSGHTWHHADTELVRIIREGGTVYMPNSRMPAYGEELNAAETLAVLAYIKVTFWGPRERVYQADVSRQWEDMLRGAEPSAVQPLTDRAPDPMVATPDD